MFSVAKILFFRNIIAQDRLWKALSASQWLLNVADGSGEGTICVTMVTKCSRWFLKWRYLRHNGHEMQQMIPEVALSASLWSRNAADDVREVTICVTLVAKCCRWFRERYYLRHNGHEMQQMIPGGVLSASLWSRNAADGSVDGTICVIMAAKCSRWFRGWHYLRHSGREMQQMVPEAALSASLLQRSVADDSWDGTICVTLATKCCR